MKNYTEVQVINNVVSSTVCNCCGKEMVYCEEMINVQHTFGYYANIFDDGAEHNIDVCETCYAKWIETFKIAPEECEGNSWRTETKNSKIKLNAVNDNDLR